MRANATFIVFPLCAALFCAASSSARAADAPKPPELKVLDRWVGTWDAEWTAKKTPWMPEGGQFTAEETIEPVLGGRFIHARIAGKTDGIHSTWLMTYDARAKAYRSWWFNSQGFISQSTAQWDEAAKTMTMNSDLGDGGKGTSVLRFPADDVFEWTFVLKGADGVANLDFAGKTTRRKAGAEKVPLAAFGAEGPAAERAELKPLAHFAGEWDTAVTSKPAAWTPNEVTSKGSVKTTWALGGHFLVQRGRGLVEGVDHVMVLGYDPRRSEYRSWYFDSRGFATDTGGQWDEALKTLSWKTEVAGRGTATATHHFTGADAYESTMVIKDADGKVLLDRQGKYARRR